MEVVGRQAGGGEGALHQSVQRRGRTGRRRARRCRESSSAGPAGRRGRRCRRRAMSRDAGGARAVSARRGRARRASASNSRRTTARRCTAGPGSRRRGVVESLGERAQRGDADAGADQGDLPPGPGARTQTPVRTLDRRGCPGRSARSAALPSPSLLDGDAQAAAVRGGRQGVRVGPGPAGPAEEPPGEELPGLDAQPVQSPAGRRRPKPLRSASRTTAVTRSPCRTLRQSGTPTR